MAKAKGTGSCKREYLRLKKAEEDHKRLLEQEEKLKAEQAAKKKAEQAAKKRREQAAKAKANEQRAKLRARKNCEENARQNCLNAPPCNGHGRGVYTPNVIRRLGVAKIEGARAKCVHGWLSRRCRQHTFPRVSMPKCQYLRSTPVMSLVGMRFNVYDHYFHRKQN